MQNITPDSGCPGYNNNTPRDKTIATATATHFCTVSHYSSVDDAIKCF